MKDIINVEFFIDTTDATSTVAIQTYDASLLVVEVQASASCTIAVQGKCNSTFTDLCCINLKNLATSTTITESGTYSISLDGMTQAQLVLTNNTGTVTVVGKLGD